MSIALDFYIAFGNIFTGYPAVCTCICNVKSRLLWNQPELTKFNVSNVTTSLMEIQNLPKKDWMVRDTVPAPLFCNCKRLSRCRAAREMYGDRCPKDLQFS